jgi:hypothetical protein
MTRARLFALVLASILPATAVASTSHDLRSRITINGDLGDFSADEWILDATTPFAEPVGDSRWGHDNDILGIALTWDDIDLYVGVPVVAISSTVMLFVEAVCGGLTNLTDAGPFRRNIEFAGIRPNVLVKTGSSAGVVDVALLDCTRPLNILDPALYRGRFRQDEDTGALELAIPWSALGAFVQTGAGTAVPADGGVVRVLTVVTGGPATGAGDAAPNPATLLDNDSTRVAILNNYIEVSLDVDNDGLLDAGVSPRARAMVAVAQTEDSGPLLPLRLVLQNKLVRPGTGNPLTFYAALDPAEYAQPVYLTARVYSADGRLLRKLFEDVPRDLSQGSPAVLDTWDGRDHDGMPAPGGVYILALSGGPALGAPKHTVKASFAIVR